MTVTYTLTYPCGHEESVSYACESALRGRRYDGKRPIHVDLSGDYSEYQASKVHQLVHPVNGTISLNGITQ